LKQSGHSLIIATAAKAHLAPIGCRRKGNSRFWFSDEQFWLIGVEFQPSGSSKGSYLNIGACWLWDVKEHFSYDTGPGRIGHFHKLETNAIFELTADALAMRASQEVLDLRKRFSTISRIADLLASEASGKTGWPMYHAAIANGLAGNLAVSRLLFEQVIAKPGAREWEEKRLAAAKNLVVLLENRQEFIGAVSDSVHRSRVMRGLSPALNWLVED